MNILIVFPDWGYFPLTYRRTIPPLSPALLAAILRDWGRVTFIDERLEAIPEDEFFDIVFISAMTNQIHRAYQLAHKFKEGGSTVVLGGVHVSLMPDEAMEHADAVFIGEIEETLPECMEDFQRGTLKKQYICQHGEGKSLRTVLPDRSIYPGRGYLPLDPVQFFRGCRLACEACSVPQTQGKAVVFRDLDHIMEDMSRAQEYLFFINDDLYFQRQHINPILDNMIGMGKWWLGLGAAEMAHDEVFLKLMRDSGCWLLYLDFGPRESLAINNPKRLPSVMKQLTERIERFKAFGIKLIGSFTFGYDFDTLSTFENTLSFCSKQGIDEAEFHLLVPYPKSRIAHKLEARNLIISRDWARYTATEVVFTPKNMSARELYEGYAGAWKTFYGLSADVQGTSFEIESLRAFPNARPEKMVY